MLRCVHIVMEAAQRGWAQLGGRRTAGQGIVQQAGNGGGCASACAAEQTAKPASTPFPPCCPSLLPRSSLLDYVRERKRLPEAEAVLIFQQLLHALQFCHRKDVSGWAGTGGLRGARLGGSTAAACLSWQRA